jgi:acetyltransferase-like isoleucine patch superfamily enzyme
VTAEILDELVLREASAELGDWFAGKDNALYLAEGLTVPELLAWRLATFSFADGLIVLASPLDSLSLLLGGEGATVFVGAGCELTAGEIYCGAGSCVVLHGRVVGTGQASLDARNGGSIVAERDQLWAARVYIATDDMHALVDLATGIRINSYGGHIRLAEHVWLGREAVVTGNVEIGTHAVVGLRSLVRGQKVPPYTAVAGTPARVVREGITWRGEDAAQFG